MTPEELKKHIGERMSYEDLLDVYDVPIILDARTFDYSGKYETAVLLWVGEDYKGDVDFSDTLFMYNNSRDEDLEFDTGYCVDEEDDCTANEE